MSAPIVFPTIAGEVGEGDIGFVVCSAVRECKDVIKCRRIDDGKWFSAQITFLLSAFKLALIGRSKGARGSQFARPSPTGDNSRNGFAMFRFLVTADGGPADFVAMWGLPIFTTCRPNDFASALRSLVSGYAGSMTYAACTVPRELLRYVVVLAWFPSKVPGQSGRTGLGFGDKRTIVAYGDFGQGDRSRCGQGAAALVGTWAAATPTLCRTVAAV